ncbi:MAG: hypothetical protein H6739_29560 [Alphaproteobacteria bacterium]|nr:hypothetical protein [Alphaproteobacteria bacterium]
MRRPLALAALALAVGLGAFLLLRGEPRSEADQVRAAIEDIAEGARAADIAATVAPVSRAYQDDDGLTRDGMKGFLFREFRSRGPIGVALGPIAVDIQGQQATASFEAALVEGVELTALDLNPDDGDVLHFDVSLQKEDDGAWRVVHHSRDRVFR